MVNLTIQLTIHDGKRMEFFHTVDSLVKLYRKEKGCVSYDHRFDQNDENKCTISAAWKTWDDLERHFQRQNFSVLLGAIQVLCAPPELKVTDGVRTMGMEAVNTAQSIKKSEEP